MSKGYKTKSKIPFQHHGNGRNPMRIRRGISTHREEQSIIDYNVFSQEKATCNPFTAGYERRRR